MAMRFCFVVGTIGAGRIGYRVLQRLMPFDCKELLYYDYAPLPEHAAAAIKARRVDKLEDMLSQVDSDCAMFEYSLLTVRLAVRRGYR